MPQVEYVETGGLGSGAGIVRMPPAPPPVCVALPMGPG